MGRHRSGRLIAAVACALLLAVPAQPAQARTVNDPALSRQWGLAKIGAPAAWDRATGAGTIIAVVDSGVDLGHEDLAGKLLPGKDYTGKGTVQDDCGHGTHVSGIAAAMTNNARGVAGVAPDAKILPVKALALDEDPLSTTYGQCVGYTSDIQDGIKWAADNNATVINLSLGSDIQFLTGSGLGDSLAYAWKKGVVAIVAAGNQTLFGSGYTDEPAIIVTATTPSDTKPSYSSNTGGARWSMSAPGGAGTGDERDVLSTYFVPGKASSYGFLAGTSMATPHVAGAAAVLRSMGLTPQQTVDRLLATATDLGAKGVDSTFGSGRLDMAKAVGTTTAASTPTGGTAAAGSNAAPSTTTRRTAAGPAGTGGGAPRSASPAAAGPSTAGAAPGGAIIADAPTGDGAVTALPLPRVVLDLEEGGTGSPEGAPPVGLMALAAAAALCLVGAGLSVVLRRQASPAQLRPQERGGSLPRQG